MWPFLGVSYALGAILGVWPQELLPGVLRCGRPERVSGLGAAWGAGVLGGSRGQPFREVPEWTLRETSRMGKDKHPLRDFYRISKGIFERIIAVFQKALGGRLFWQLAPRHDLFQKCNNRFAVLPICFLAQSPVTVGAEQNTIQHRYACVLR